MFKTLKFPLLFGIELGFCGCDKFEFKTDQINIYIKFQFEEI